MLVRRMLVAGALASVLSCVMILPASASVTSPMPRAAEWWLINWQVPTRVWPLTQGAGVTVALLDSGVQASVSDLRGAVVPGGDVTGAHTNGEHDFNSVGDGHGTQMAVLLAGRGYEGGLVGIAPEAKIMPVVVTAAAADLTAPPGNVAAGIRYAVDNGAKIIDISQVYPSSSASGCDAAEQAAVSYALAKNIVVVAAEASSNLIGDSPSEPASCAGVLSVGAIGRDQSRWSGDVPEPYLTVLAPGADLISSGRDGKIVTENGTRSAAALVAGVAALIRSRYPSMPWQQVIQRIIGTASPGGASAPTETSGFGIVRPSDALTATVPASTPDPVYARYLAWLRTREGRAGTRVTVPKKAAPAAGRVSGALLIAVAAGLAIGLVVTITVVVTRSSRRRPQVFELPRSWIPESPPGRSPRPPAPDSEYFSPDDTEF
jgi:subtilisin family serine protease